MQDAPPRKNFVFKLDVLFEEDYLTAIHKLLQEAHLAMLQNHNLYID